MSAEMTPLHEEVLQQLTTVIDPELGIDIVNLGLIYGIGVEDTNGHVDIVMTLTVPGCPMHDTIKMDVERAVTSVPWVSDVNVKVTFEPPWSPERMSEEAHRQLGR